MNALYVAIAGGIGAAARYGVSLLLSRPGRAFPWATLAVNVLGSLAIGVVMAAALSRGSMDSRLRVAITVGLLGGFTTYSAFAYETVLLAERRSVAAASAYVVATLVGAGIACLAGVYLGRRL